MRVLILGAGLMARGALHRYLELPETKSVVIADRSDTALKNISAATSDERVSVTQIDAADTEAVRKLMQDADVVFSAMHYGLNENLAKLAIETKTHMVDLGGNNDIVNAELALDEQAQSAGVSIIPDCGLAPGLASMLVAWAVKHFDWAKDINIFVGGLPLNPQEPLRYERLFNVEGLINEYVEPPVFMRDSKIIEGQPLGDIEHIDVGGKVGTLEAFNTSGGVSTLPETYQNSLRSIAYRTLRYPGHAHAMRWLYELGLMSSDSVTLDDGTSVVPRKLLAQQIVKNVPECQRDCTVVVVDVKGENEQSQRIQIIDEYDEETSLTSMMRMTAFPAVTASVLQYRGEITRAGVQPQERALDPDVYMTELASAGIAVPALAHS